MTSTANIKAVLAAMKAAPADQPTTKTIREAAAAVPEATKSEVIAAGSVMGYNPSTVAVQYSRARAGTSAPKEGQPPRPGKAKKHDKDLPEVGARIKFIWTGKGAAEFGMVGKPTDATVLGHRERAIIVMPDPVAAKYGQNRKLSTFCYKPQIVA